MIESLPLGHTTCDYLRVTDFTALCRQHIERKLGLYHIVTLNPEMVLQAETDEAFRAAVAGADLRVPDGAGLIWARWYLRSNFWSLIPSLLAFPFIVVERVSGVDSVLTIANICRDEHKSIYLLGGTTTQATKAAALMQKKFPGITVHIAKPHTKSLMDADTSELLADINRVQPDVLLVAYGAPMQTLWIERYRHELPSVRLAMGVGGAFAILSEERPRAPRWLRRGNLEWLWRLILEPRRLKRIWHATITFPRLIKRQRQAAPPTFPTLE